MAETNEKPVSNLLNDDDREAYVNNPPPKKPNPIAKILGTIGLIGSAVAVAPGAIGGTTQGSITQPYKDAANITREIADHVIPKDDKQDEQNTAPTLPTPVRQEATEQEAASSSPDLAELNTIFDTFVDDLKKIPAAKIGSPNAEVEMYKVAIGEETVKFTRQPSETNHELDKITVEITSDAKKESWEILGNDITVKLEDNSANKEEAPENPVKSADERLTERLTSLHDKWIVERGNSGENVTSSDQAIPPRNAQFAEPIATNTPEPTPTPNPAFDPPGPFDRENHEAVAPTNPEPSNPQETTVQAPPNPSTEIQSEQPAATDSTTPKSDL